MKSKLFILTISVVGILIFALALGLFSPMKSKPKKIEGRGDGLAAPPFKLLNLKGETVDSSAFQGKVVLLDFWATWCPPCREEIPHLNELYEKYKEDGLVIIGISLDRGGPEGVKKFLEKFKVGYINVIGDEGVLEAYNRIPGMGPIQGIPTTFVIDRNGQIRQRFSGYTEKKVFEEAIKRLL